MVLIKVISRLLGDYSEFILIFVLPILIAGQTTKIFHNAFFGKNFDLDTNCTVPQLSIGVLFF